jgi:hypothetical protein
MAGGISRAIEVLYEGLTAFVSAEFFHLLVFMAQKQD